MVETDEEQLEALKNWWDENGTSLVTTIVLALTVVFGYRAWEDSVRETGEAASGIYENLVQAASDPSDDNLRITALNLGEELKTEHEGSTYAVFAALHLARLAVDEGKPERAQAELEWVISQRPEMNLETIARMRLARVLIATGDPTAAMEKLSNYQPGEGQKSSWEEVRGDVFVALGDDVSARQAYQVAIEQLGDKPARPILELKLANIPVGSTTSASEDGDP